MDTKSLNRDYTLLHLRILVLTLGEVPHAGWWKSRFLSSTGLSYLSRLYPRSSFAAAVRSATRAARAVHDSSIGIGSVYHLFRLLPGIERQMDETLRETETELEVRFTPLLGQPERLLEELRLLGGQHPVTRTAVGPLHVGVLREAGEMDWVAQLASVYYAAFRDGVKVFPYFEIG